MEDESGELRKVLGLIWETEADRLKVDVKLNLQACISWRTSN
jgi:hypothetical protein